MAGLQDKLTSKLRAYQEIVEIFREALSEKEMTGLNDAIQRMQSLTVAIAVFGRTQAGKSSLLNTLLGYDNDDPKRPYSSSEEANKWSDDIEKSSTREWKNLSGLNIILQDTPGISGDFIEHQNKANELAKRADVVLFVTDGNIVGAEKVALDGLLKTNRPLVVAINKCDRYREKELQSIKKDAVDKWPILENMMAFTAGHPIQKDTIIDELLEKITLVVQTQQEQLIWKTVEAHIADKKPLVAEILLKRKRGDAGKQIHTAAASAASLSAVVPTPLDEAGLTAIHIALVKSLGTMFGQTLDKQAAVTIIGLVAGAAVGKTVANFAMNFIPGVGNAFRAATTFAHTEALGWAAFKYFKSNFNPIPVLNIEEEEE